MKMNTLQQVEYMTKLNDMCNRAENLGREFFKTNNNYTDAVNEARKLFTSVLERESFVCGRNLQFWGR